MSPKIRRKGIRVIDKEGKQRGSWPVRESELLGRCRREGPLPALHAEGDPRATARDRQHRCRSELRMGVCSRLSLST